MFSLWNAEPHRATRDLDLLVMGDSTAAALRDILTNDCLERVEADLRFPARPPASATFNSRPWKLWPMAGHLDFNGRRKIIGPRWKRGLTIAFEGARRTCAAMVFFLSPMALSRSRQCLNHGLTGLRGGHGLPAAAGHPIRDSDKSAG